MLMGLLKYIPIAENVSFKELSKKTPGYVAADLKALGKLNFF
jgi:hypothetical protein